jgi:hypothetical protein
MTDIIQIITEVTHNAFKAAAWSVIVQLAAIYIVTAITISGVNYLLSTYTDIGRDATDPPAGRSDMIIMTDHQTGCQYLMGSRGGLTPRLDENGKQMCTKTGGAA